MAKLQYPYFAKGSMDDLLYALEYGEFADIDKIAYVFLTDTQKLAFVDVDKSIHPIVGDNPDEVIRVDTLPSVSEARTDTLYILGSTVYSFDGEAFHPTYSDVTDQISLLSEAVESISTAQQKLQTDFTALQYTVEQKADKADTLAGYGIQDAYTKEGVHNLIGDMGSSATVSDFVQSEVQDYVDNAMKITVV